MLHSAKTKRETMHARCHRVTLLARDFAIKGCRHDSIWSERAKKSCHFGKKQPNGRPKTECVRLISLRLLLLKFYHQRSRSAYRTPRLVLPLILKVQSKVLTGAVQQRFVLGELDPMLTQTGIQRRALVHSMYRSRLQIWSNTAATVHCALWHRPQRS